MCLLVFVNVTSSVHTWLCVNSLYHWFLKVQLGSGKGQGILEDEAV